jgi:hypothetical protein
MSQTETILLVAIVGVGFLALYLATRPKPQTEDISFAQATQLAAIIAAM